MVVVGIFLSVCLPHKSVMNKADFMSDFIANIVPFPIFVTAWISPKPTF